MSLANKIYLTRKCRINLSERLKRYNLFFQLLIIWYSFLLIVITIFFKNELIFQDLILTLSIGVLVFSSLIAGMNYPERAIKAQILYTQLDFLYSQVDKATEDQKESLYKQYTDLIALTENHSEQLDFLKVKYSLRNEDKDKYPNPPALKWYEYIIYWLEKVFFLSLVIFSFALPFLILLWIKY